MSAGGLYDESNLNGDCLQLQMPQADEAVGLSMQFVGVLFNAVTWCHHELWVGLLQLVRAYGMAQPAFHAGSICCSPANRHRTLKSKERCTVRLG